MQMPTTHAEATILVVDDEPLNVRVLTLMLEGQGYRSIVSTSDSREALTLYERHRPDLVLLDIRMPHLDGFQVMEQLNVLEWDSYAPIIVLTAQTDSETRMRALETGAKDFLTKPFDHNEIAHRIRNMLEMRLLQNAATNQNRILEEEVRKRTREIEDTRMEIVRRLGRAAEYKDCETGLHIIRMSKYSQLLGLAAGMDEQQAELLLTASPMHDIGKIGIPDHVLLKPGKLDKDEWEVMKQHPQIGADILAGHDSELLEVARSIAVSHHEKWDGSGYPQGLKGDSIPLEGRIVAICDVFDALTSERPYKRAWSVDEAIAEIKQCAGTHFDPELVEQFIAILPEILAIKQDYAEPAGSDDLPEAASGH